VLVNDICVGKELDVGGSTAISIDDKIKMTKTQSELEMLPGAVKGKGLETVKASKTAT